MIAGFMCGVGGCERVVFEVRRVRRGIVEGKEEIGAAGGAWAALAKDFQKFECVVVWKSLGSSNEV